MSNKISYRVTGLLAEGGMAQLFNIVCSDGRRAVLRQLHGRYVWRLKPRRRFVNGLQLRAELSPHEHIASTLEFGSRWLKPYEIIELVEGVNLKVLINQRNEALRMHCDEILLGAAKALAYMHQKKLLHLDVKPENFLVDCRDRFNPLVKLTDFDLACTLEQGRSSRPSGTPAYMAPEQFNLKLSLRASDVFAFGVMAYHAYSGRFPFSGNSELQTMRNQADENVRPRPIGEYCPELSPRMERVIMRCLAKRVQERYPDMSACLNDMSS